MRNALGWQAGAVLSGCMVMSGIRTLPVQAEQNSSHAATTAVAPLPEAVLLRAELDELGTCWLKSGSASKTRDWNGEGGRFARSLERADRSSASVATQLRVVTVPGRNQRTAVAGTGVFRSEIFRDNVSLHFEATTSMIGVGQSATLELFDGQRTVASFRIGGALTPQLGDAKWVRLMLRSAVASVPLPHGAALNLKSICGVPRPGNGAPRVGRQCEDVVTTPAERKKIVADAKAALARDAQFVDDNMATIEQMLPSLFPFSDNACLRKLGAFGKR